MFYIIGGSIIMKMFIICLCGGWFGLHKFVEKKPGMGILYFCTLGLFCVGWIVDTVRYFKIYQNDKRKQAMIEEQKRIETEKRHEWLQAEQQREQERQQAKQQKEQEQQRHKQAVEEARKKIADNPEEYQRLHDLCVDIHNEYKGLLTKYRKFDIENDYEEMVWILKECFRKLEVLATNIEYYLCYDEIDPWDEQEKICRKAKSFINSYIKERREQGDDDYEIDITQFAFELSFIADYIYEKDNKLNKM